MAKIEIKYLVVPPCFD